MKSSWNLLKFIFCREAFVPIAYRDGGTDEAPKYSYGFGSQLTMSGEWVKPDDTITIEEAVARVREHLISNDKVMTNLIHLAIAQHEWDAAASLFYQSGIDEIREVAGWFNAKVDIIDIAEGLLQWNYIMKDGKKVRLKGLSIRRTREELLMKAGDYGDISRYRYYPGDPNGTIPEWRAFPENEI